MQKNIPYSTRQRGAFAEQQAQSYLEAQGLKLVESNFYCRMGEIDLIMRDGEILVFVEVRMRNRHNLASGLESVDFRKQRKIIKTAKLYLQKRGLFDKVLCRFDVVEMVDGQATWVAHAFEEASQC